MKILIIGFGSIGKRHYKILKKINNNFDISVYSRSNKKITPRVNDLTFKTVKNFDYILICNETYLHIKTLKKIYSNKLNIKIFIEKPLSNKKINISKMYKNIYVGYNLRFHPVIQYIKKNINIDKVLNINIRCMTNLRDWRKRDYSKSYSASKKLGGGVHFDLSHEIDYLIWLFGSPIKYNIYKKKLSNLSIDSIDTFILSGTLKKNKLFNVQLCYYSKKNIREVILTSNQNLFICDLLNYEIKIFSSNINKKIKFNKNINSTYERQHIDILYGKEKMTCNFKEASYVSNLLI